MRDSGHILLEGAPAQIDTRELADDLIQACPDIIDVHHVHAWSITEDRPVITLHARVSAGALPEQVTAGIKARLAERYGVDHATVEVEFGGCADARTPGGKRAPLRETG